MKEIPALCFLSASSLARMLRKGEITSVELTRAFLQSIAAQNEKWNAYVEVYEEEALEEAAASDARRRLKGRGENQKGGNQSANNQRGEAPLEGVPVAVTDNFMQKGRLCTCQSPALSSFVSPYDAGVVEKLKGAGMPLLGRLGMSEFGMSGADPVGRAVAACMAPIALGSDTGGHFRQAAASSGLVGVRPAYGTVSRYGLAAFAGSMDQAAPMAKTAQDAALLLNTIAGPDPRDATLDTSLHADFTGELNPSLTLHGMTFAIPEECLKSDLAALEKTGERLSVLGATVKAHSLPSIKNALSAYSVLASAEAASNLARYEGADFGPEVKERIRAGLHSLCGEGRALLTRAQHDREVLTQELSQALSAWDALLLPDPLSSLASLGRLPALTLPCGLQLMGGRQALPRLLGICSIYERAYFPGKGGASA